MGRKSRQLTAQTQAAEAQRLMDLAKLPPPPGSTAAQDLPRIRIDTPTYNQPEYTAYEAARQKGDAANWRNYLAKDGLPVGAVASPTPASPEGLPATSSNAGDTSAARLAAAIEKLSGQLEPAPADLGATGDASYYEPAGYDLAAPPYDPAYDLVGTPLEPAETEASAEGSWSMTTILLVVALVGVGLYLVSR